MAGKGRRFGARGVGWGEAGFSRRGLEVPRGEERTDAPSDGRRKGSARVARRDHRKREEAKRMKEAAATAMGQTWRADGRAGCKGGGYRRRIPRVGQFSLKISRRRWPESKRARRRDAKGGCWELQAGRRDGETRRRDDVR
jgi:hypothetical protein